jgi:hypothetical protein
VDASGHNKEGGHEDDKAGIFMESIEKSPSRMEREKIVENRDSPEQKRNFCIMALPPMECQKWHQSNSQKLAEKREE